jgi:uncharacterized protein DUF4232
MVGRAALVAGGLLGMALGTGYASAATQADTAGVKAPLCKSSDLTVSLGPGEGAAGSAYFPLQFTNISDTPCLVSGFPSVSYVTGDDLHQVGRSSARTGEPATEVPVGPGSVVHAVIKAVNVYNYEEAVCQPTLTRGVVVTLTTADSAYPTFLPVTGTACANVNLPGEQLTVGAIQPGSGETV